MKCLDSYLSLGVDSGALFKDSSCIPDIKQYLDKDVEAARKDPSRNITIIGGDFNFNMPK